MADNKRKSKAAYTLLDLSDLDEDVRKDIIEDASAGGGQFGVRVVEEAVNGPARAPIYGVYNEGPDADRWADAKKEFGISGSEISDNEAYAGAGAELNDPRREAALREAAALEVEAQADRIRSGEESAVAEITGDTDSERAARRTHGGTTGGDHPQNIVDTGLDPDATNEAADAENQKASKASKSKTKTPR